jgi:Protein of unknown function (DUF3429)
VPRLRTGQTRRTPAARRERGGPRPRLRRHAVSRVPAAAWALGIAGVLPFVYGVLLIFAAPGSLPSFGVVDPGPAGGTQMLERFGAAILAFMGGCLWGFASAPGRVPSLFLLSGSAVPAFIAFVATGPDPSLSCIWLAFGFVVLQAIDVAYARAGVAPDYWLALRLPLTAVVMACLLAGGLYG